MVAQKLDLRATGTEVKARNSDHMLMDLMARTSGWSLDR